MQAYLNIKFKKFFHSIKNFSLLLVSMLNNVKYVQVWLNLRVFFYKAMKQADMWYKKNSLQE